MIQHEIAQAQGERRSFFFHVRNIYRLIGTDKRQLYSILRTEMRGKLKNLSFWTRFAPIWPCFALAILALRLYIQIIRERENTAMKNVEVLAGTSIEKACAQLVAAAAADPSQIAQCEFNGVMIAAHANSLPSDLVNQWGAEFDRRSAEYRKSPEGIRAEQKAEERQQEAQATYNRCMAMLPSLDFQNDEAMLDWMTKIQDAADHIGVKKHPQVILKAFGEHGFNPDMNCGNNFDGEDRHNVAAYIIGQCLDGFRTVGAPHPVVHRFVADWKEKFLQ